jgi:four helix bundle protein
MARQRSIHSYRDLEVWRRGIDLVERVYKLTQSFPPEEKYGLTSQLRRAAVAISSNIAEGWGRDSTKDYVHFVRIARSSLLEIETQLIIAHRLGYLNEDALKALLQETEAESKMLLSLIRSLRR